MVLLEKLFLKGVGRLKVLKVAGLKVWSSVRVLALEQITTKEVFQNAELIPYFAQSNFFMEHLIYSLELQSFLAEGLKDSQTSLIDRIKEQHRLILDKLLPEIDMHFAAVSKQKSPFDEALTEAHEAFSKFSELLIDHIYMEDYIVFPELVLEEKPLVSAIRDFVTQHDDFEAMLHELLLSASESLKPLQELLPFRILLLKMARLELLLAEHNVLEDLLFKDFH